MEAQAIPAAIQGMVVPLMLDLHLVIPAVRAGNIRDGAVGMGPAHCLAMGSQSRTVQGSITIARSGREATYRG